MGSMIEEKQELRAQKEKLRKQEKNQVAEQTEKLRGTDWENGTLTVG